MKPLKINQVKNAIKGYCQEQQENLVLTGVSTDSRTICPGDLFVPLEGPKYDGHDFIKQAFLKGAAAALCSASKKDKVYGLDYKKIIFVENTKLALLSLAAYYRSLFPIPFIAITGSVGKTTTKEMISAVLQTRYKVIKTQGNLNNEIGLPLTIFRLDESHEIGVVELGMSGLGEIRRMANVVKPEISVITNIGITHIEKLKTRENILKAKLEILEPLKKKDLAVLNGDCDELWQLRGKLVPELIFFGQRQGDIKAKNVIDRGIRGFEFEICGRYGQMVFNVSLPGIHNLNNALAAIVTGFEMGLTKQEIQRGLLNIELPKMRLQFKKSYFGADIIDDAYNASPDSMKAAIDFLQSVGKAKKKAVILGDMLELGDVSKEAHRQIGEYAAQKTDVFIAVGNHAPDYKEGAVKHLDCNCIHTFPNIQQAVLHVERLVEDCEIILIKASRGMMMEKITKVLVRGPQIAH